MPCPPQKRKKSDRKTLGKEKKEKELIASARRKESIRKWHLRNRRHRHPRTRCIVTTKGERGSWWDEWDLSGPALVILTGLSYAMEVTLGLQRDEGERDQEGHVAHLQNHQCDLFLHGDDQFP